MLRLVTLRVTVFYIKKNGQFNSANVIFSIKELKKPTQMAPRCISHYDRFSSFHLLLTSNHRDMGSQQTVAEFKKTIEDDIEQSEKKRIDEAFKNRLLKKLVQANPVQVPASLLKDQKAALIEDFKKRMTDQGMPEPEFAAYIQKWDADFSNSAAEMIQSSFLIDKLAQEHDMGCKKEDVDAKFDEYSKQTGIELARIKEWYSKPEQLSRLTYMITEEKVVKLLTDKAKVKEVDAKELKEEQN